MTVELETKNKLITEYEDRIKKMEQSISEKDAIIAEKDKRIAELTDNIRNGMQIRVMPSGLPVRTVHRGNRSYVMILTELCLWRM